MIHTKRIIQVSFSQIRYFEVKFILEDYLSYYLFLVKVSAGTIELLLGNGVKTV